MKEVADKKYRKFDFADLDKKVPARVPAGSISAMELALKANPSDWYYKDKGNHDSMVYENLDHFNYYLVRGFAVIVSAGFGALGSDGFNFVGSDYERDASNPLWNGCMATGLPMRTGKVPSRRRQTGLMETWR